MMTKMRYDGYCPNCDPFGDCGECVCGYCLPEKLEDFENGYVTELGECLSRLDWTERANAHPLNLYLFLRCRFQFVVRGSCSTSCTVSLHTDSPTLAMLKGSSPVASNVSF